MSAAPTALTDDQLDVVQHPTLGPLKFPKDMPYNERNDSIDRLEKSQMGAPQKAAGIETPGVAPLPKEIQPEDKNATVHFDVSGNRIEPHTNIIEQAAAKEDERATREGAAMSRAASSPTPMTNAVNVLSPVAAARSVVGAKLAALVGKRIAPALGLSPETGEAVAGLTGGLLAGGHEPHFLSRARQMAAESVVGPLTFEGGGEAGADVRSGINPNRALANEPGMTGSKRALVGEVGIPGKIGERVSEIKEAANQILDNHQYGDRPMDAGVHIDAAIDNAIARAEKTAGATERLENLRTALRTKYGATQGTPRQMNNLASDIQRGASDLGAFKNTRPIEASAASAMRDAARRIRNNVNEIVPEAAQLNSRMADLLDAQSGITRNLSAERGQSIFGGDRSGLFSTALNRTIGSAPVRTRIAQMLTAGKKFPIPRPEPTMPATSFLRRLGMGPTPFPPRGGPGPVDAEFRDIQTNLPGSGRTIITPRAGVESVPGAPELKSGPASPGTLNTAPEAKQLPPARQIQVGPSSLTPEEAVKAGGGKFVGIQKMYGVKPDVALFQAGDKGTTISIPAEGATPEAVRAKIAEATGKPPTLGRQEDALTREIAEDRKIARDETATGEERRIASERADQNEAELEKLVPPKIYERKPASGPLKRSTPKP